MRFVDIHTHGNQSDADAIRIFNLIPGEKLPESFFSVGIHPWYANKYTIDQVEEIIKAHPDKCVAIGECGLDLLRSPLGPFEQEELFRAHLELARKYNKPVILHMVRAAHVFGRIIKDFSDLTFIWHGFNAKPDVFHQLKNRNVYYSFGPSVKSEYVWEHIDVEKILCETDDSNENIETVYQNLASIRNLNEENLKKQIFANAIKVFGDGLER
ncbi:MAG: hypothetical protein C0592_01380 [Marinilabiliales bacterium]|nr:MAG: hypothetical protein C0592_01380 [Marinilabiliales bacterium]